MKVQDALNKRIPRIRQPQWANPNAYLRLPLMKDGTHGPWAELYDKWGQEAIGVLVGSQKMFIGEIATHDGYEVYDGPVSEHEADPANYALAYTEE